MRALMSSGDVVAVAPLPALLRVLGAELPLIDARDGGAVGAEGATVLR
jgi:hypothetical protein